MIFRGRLTGLKHFAANNLGIKFRFSVPTDQGEMEIFSDSYTTASDDDKSRVVAGMTRRRLKILGLDMDKCGPDEWISAMAVGPDGWSHFLDGGECDLEQKVDSYGTKYDIMTSQGVDQAGLLAMFSALQGAKGPRNAPVAPPVAPPAYQAPSTTPSAAPARPSAAAPAPMAAPRPSPSPRPMAPQPAATGARPSPI